MEPKRLGKYILLEKIGEGATAEVYHGRDPALDRDVAIKILKPGLVLDRDAFDRFQRGARSAARLSHPAIVTVYELGQAENRYFIVMSYVAGTSLDQWIKQNGPLPWDQVIKLAQQIGDALDYAHSKNVLHRDVKPGNILVTPEENFVLTDFGLARALQETSGTSTGVVMGTPYYIAPELWDGKPASTASDQYALACVIYEALTGQVLFHGDTPAAVMKKHIIDGVRLNPSLPPAHASVLCKALEKNPENRYRSLQQLSENLTESKDRQAANLPDRLKSVEATAFVKKIEDIQREAALLDWDRFKSVEVPAPAKKTESKDIKTALDLPGPLRSTEVAAPVKKTEGKDREAKLDLQGHLKSDQAPVPANKIESKDREVASYRHTPPYIVYSLVLTSMVCLVVTSLWFHCSLLTFLGVILMISIIGYLLESESKPIITIIFSIIGLAICALPNAPESTAIGVFILSLVVMRWEISKKKLFPGDGRAFKVRQRNSISKSK